MKQQPSSKSFVALVCVLAALTPAVSFAGVGGGEFDAIYTTLVDWSQGTLGRILAVIMVIVGIGAGVLRNSIGGVVTGVGAGLILYNAPTVIDNVVGAVLIGGLTL